MGSLATGESFEFEGFRLERRGLFRRDERGVFVPIAMGSRAFDVLRVLITAQGDLLAKDEIMAAVWPGTVVEDNNLTVQISALRRILDAAQSGQSCIQTVAGRGYRFVAPVTRCAVGMDQHPRDLSRTGVEPSVALANARSPEPQPSSISSAERRQLTVMICDLVGARVLAARLDPEDLREIIAAYHRAIAEIAAEFDGLIGKHMSDGVMVYFGYPQAHEDDAERAVRAGLGMIDAVGRLHVGAGKLQARVGIATGLVVVGGSMGEGPAREQSVVGEAPHLAAGLQASAQADTVVIAAGTRRLVGALFEYRDLGAVAVHGIVEPVRAWQPLRPSIVASRFEALRGSALSPLVGRDEEIDLLLRRWARAKAGNGQVVLVSGEPGLGKSRIAAAFGEGLHAEPHLRLRYFCSPYHQDSALFPFIGQLERAAGFDHDDTPEARVVKLETLVAASAPVESDVPLLAELLSVPSDSRYPPLDLSPQLKKEKTFEALFRQFTKLAQQRPVLMIFEDLQWADPTSRELLDLIVERVASLAVLLIATFRPEFQSPWTDQPHVTALSLRRLERNESDELIRGIVGNASALSNQVVEEIAERTDGVPLFLEELTKAVLETAIAGTELSTIPPASLAVPATLHASLMARLDRLGPTAKEIAQVGAAIGREFAYELLAAVSQLTETELREGLARLVNAGLIFQRGMVPQAIFLFKHALVQDIAYNILLRGPRRELHAKIALALEKHSTSMAEMRPQILAHHFTEAGLLENAVTYWCRAGRRSASKSALLEAIGQVRKALPLIKALPDAREYKLQELELLVTLAGALMGVRGYAHPEVAEAFVRARNLVLETEGQGTVPHFSVLYGLWVADFVGGKPKVSLERAEEFLSCAQTLKDSGLLVKGHQLVGTTLLSVGDYTGAFSHLQRAVALFAGEEHRALAISFTADVGIAALCNWAWALWHRGYPDQAADAADQALQHARQSAHVPTLAYALIHLCIKAALERRAAEAEHRTDEAVALAKEHGLAMWSGYGLMLQGWALSQRAGQSEAAVERIRAGLAATRETAARNWEPFCLGLLAEALAATGEIEEGLLVLAEAFATADTSGQKGTDAELHRLRGDLLRCSQSPNWIEVEACFRTALAIAREQGTRGFELRAAASLARLLGKQGRRDEARDLLAPVYRSFSEGFDMPDLKEAKALLAEL